MVTLGPGTNIIQHEIVLNTLQIGPRSLAACSTASDDGVAPWASDLEHKRLPASKPQVEARETQPYLNLYPFLHLYIYTPGAHLTPV